MIEKYKKEVERNKWKIVYTWSFMMTLTTIDLILTHIILSYPNTYEQTTWASWIFTQFGNFGYFIAFSINGIAYAFALIGTVCLAEYMFRNIEDEEVKIKKKDKGLNIFFIFLIIGFSITSVLNFINSITLLMSLGTA